MKNCIAIIPARMGSKRIKEKNIKYFFKKPIIASGGVTSLKDLQTLKDNEKNGIEGVICGRAIYEGKIDITEANKIFEIN